MNTDIALPGNHTEVTFNSGMLAQFMAEWRDGADIHGIVGRAKNNPNWPLDPSVIIWGATNLWRYYPY